MARLLAAVAGLSRVPPLYLVGLGISPHPDAPAVQAASRLVSTADVLVGGRSQLALFPTHTGETLLVDADVESLYSRIERLRREKKTLVVLCSGDPLYFGLGARLAERFGPEAVKVIPGLSSMQAAACFLGISWETMRSVSLHGRSGMLPLAHALMAHRPVCLLCDARTSPAAIARWLIDRGSRDLTLHLLDDLRVADDGSVSAASHLALDLERAAGLGEDSFPRRVLVLQPDAGIRPCRPFGINDRQLATDKGIFTKRPVRAAGLACLEIEPDDTVWDVGAGSGAVGIEAARLACRGQVFAFESGQERLVHIHANRSRANALVLEIIPGVFPNCLESLSAPLPRPNKIFVGGGMSGASANTLLRFAWDALLPGGLLLAHCVLLSSLELARAVLCELAGDVEVSSVQIAQSSPLGQDMQLKALNPVFLVLARKQRAGNGLKDRPRS